jgi:glyoxylase I family protein
MLVRRCFFAFELFERIDDDVHGFREIVLVHPGTGVVLCLQQHERTAAEAFDPRRTGLDHLAFKVSQRSELDTWMAHLDAVGVTYSPVADMPYGSVLCLRDPDQVQLELFYRLGH